MTTLTSTESTSAELQPCDLYRHGGAQAPLITHRLEVSDVESLWLCGTCHDNCQAWLQHLRGEVELSVTASFRARRLAERIFANQPKEPSIS